MRKWLGFVALVFGLMFGWILGKWQKGIGVTDLNQKISPTIAIDHDATVEAKLRQYVEKLTGDYSVEVVRLESGKIYGINREVLLPARSLIKIPVMIATIEEIQRKNLNWDQQITLLNSDIDNRSGPLFQFPGTAFTIDRLLYEMGNKSDMTAQAAIRRILSLDKVKQEMAFLGMKNTDYEQGTTTADDIGLAWKYIYKKYKDDTMVWQKIHYYLSESIYETGIPAGLPDEVDLVHKVGTDVDVWNDGGIIFPKCIVTNNLCPEPFILVILNQNVDLEEAKKTLPEITKIIWDYEMKL